MGKRKGLQERKADRTVPGPARRTPWPWLGGLAFAGVVVAALLSRGRDAPPPSSAEAATPAAAPQTAASAPTSGPATRDDGVITLDQSDWRGLDDPSRDGWSSEVVQNALSKQLKQIGHAIELDAQRADAGAVAALQWPTLVLDEVAGTAWIAALPAAAAPMALDTHTPAERAPGGATLRAAVAEVASALRRAGRGPSVHVAWKIDGLRVEGGDTRATLRLFASAQGPDAGIDLQTRFYSTWRRGADGGFRLAELRADDASAAIRRGAPWLVDQTEAWLGTSPLRAEIGLDIDDVLQRVARILPTDPIGHTGLALADVDGDGLDDLYVGAPTGLPNRLLLGTPGGGFVDATAGSGADYLDETRAVLLLDLDGDGRRDLVAATSAGLMLAPNIGAPGERPRFGPARRLLGLTVAHSLSAADVDGDGDLDLYAGVFYGGGERGNAGFPIPIPYHDANNGGRNALLRNEGGLRFHDATVELGLDVHNRRFTQATSFFDVDQDGDQDLYVANDHGRNAYYRNDGGHFQEVAGELGVEDMGAGMSVHFGDADGDGDFDLYVSNMYSSAGGRIVPQEGFGQAAPTTARSDVLRHARGNTLLIANGDGHFDDASERSGAMVAGWAWGSRFVDLDADGRQDLLVANGLYTRPDPGDL